MENLKIDIKGTVLTITIDTAKVQGVSKSGKSNIIATTGGNQKIKVGDAEVSVGVNVYRKI